MTEQAETLHAFRRVEAALRRAREASFLAYQFNANSYSNGALEAVIAAQIALEGLGETISDTPETP